MRKKFFFILFAFAGAIVIIACGLLPHPDTFKLEEGEAAPIEGFILSDINLVNKICDNEIHIHKNGACSIKRPDLTTNYFEFTVTMYSGDGLRVMTRKDRKKYKNQPGIFFEWTKDGSVVYENGKELARTNLLKAPVKSPVKISFINEGSYFLFIADCDTIVKGRTNLPESEYYILQSMNSELDLSGISFKQLYGFDRDQILEISDEEGKTREETIITK
jgi:hypothetical protein